MRKISLGEFCPFDVDNRVGITFHPAPLECRLKKQRLPQVKSASRNCRQLAGTVRRRRRPEADPHAFLRFPQHPRPTCRRRSQKTEPSGERQCKSCEDARRSTVDPLLGPIRSLYRRPPRLLSDHHGYICHAAAKDMGEATERIRDAGTDPRR